MSDKILIYGKNGQVASALAVVFGAEAIAISHDEADFSVYENIGKKLGGKGLKAIINATAYTNVDKAEEEREAAYKANCDIPKSLAKYCREKNIPFIHYSTDYVFAGEGEKPYTEDDATAPLNIYGKTKLSGENAIIQEGGKFLIFRTSWVYDESRRNFLTTMLRLGAEREELSVVSDQYGAPTYAADIASATKTALENATAMDKFPSGIYHLCNDGQTSWFEYAREIFNLARKTGISIKVQNVNPIPTIKYPSPAKRPLNSRLNCSKAFSILNIKMPNWRNSLEKAIENIRNSS